MASKIVKKKLTNHFTGDVNKRDFTAITKRKAKPNNKLVAKPKKK